MIFITFEYIAIIFFLNLPLDLTFNNEHLEHFYLQAVGVCDYTYNVDCQGAATPKPLPLPPPETDNGSQNGGSPPSTGGSQQPPSSGLPPGSGGSQQPIPPSSGGLPPGSGGSQQPTQPPPVTFPPGAYPQNQWGFRINPDHWHQRSSNAQSIIIDDDLPKAEALQASSSEDEDLPEEPTLVNPWGAMHAIPAELTKVPCENGKVHRLDDACTSVVVCKNSRPQLIQCDTGLIYDRPSDSCRHFTVAKW